LDAKLNTLIKRGLLVIFGDFQKKKENKNAKIFVFYLGSCFLALASSFCTFVV